MPPGAPHRIALQSILQRRAGGAEIQRVDLGAPILKSMLHSGFFVFLLPFNLSSQGRAVSAEKQLEQRVDLGAHILKSTFSFGNTGRILSSTVALSSKCEKKKIQFLYFWWVWGTHSQKYALEWLYQLVSALGH